MPYVKNNSILRDNQMFLNPKMVEFFKEGKVDLEEFISRIKCPVCNIPVTIDDVKKADYDPIKLKCKDCIRNGATTPIRVERRGRHKISLK